MVMSLMRKLGGIGATGAAALLLMAGAAYAQDESPPTPSISGHVEAGYYVVASEPGGQGTISVPTRSFDGEARNSFLLNAAHVVISHELSDRVSATIEFDAGSDAQVVSGGNLFDVQEAYVTYTSPGGFSLTAGKFVTYAGIEVIEGPANPTVTRGYLFGLAEAFTHVGAKAHYTTDTYDIGVGVVNGWDTLIDGNSSKLVMFRAGSTPSDMFGVGVSGYFAVGSDVGDADRDLVSIDVTGSAQVSEAVRLNFQGNWGRQKEAFGPADGNWFGVTVQPVYTAGDFSFGSRVEYFKDSDGFRTGLADDASLLNITLTPGYALGSGVTVRFEYRADIVLDGTTGGIETKDLLVGERSQHSVAVGLYYTF
jgi:hypothetical protein